MRLSNNTVLVTGGAGFIGSHLAEELVKLSYRVIIVDNLSTGKLENIDILLKRGDVDFIQGSITDHALVKKLVKNIDYIFHQAAFVSVPRSIEDPLAATDVNVIGTLNLLLEARKQRVKKIICASSSSVYGNTPTLPKRENMIPSPLSPYAVTKLALEYYCNVFRQTYGVSTCCLRYFNVYGPRQDPYSQYAAAIPAFIGKILQDQSPVIFGDGEQTRDFTFIDDVVQANILAVRNDAEGIYNIGGGKNTTINRLIETIISLIGKDLQPIYNAARVGEPKHSLADISSARSFGYKPEWTLEKGLSKTIKEFRS